MEAKCHTIRILWHSASPEPAAATADNTGLASMTTAASMTLVNRAGFVAIAAFLALAFAASTCARKHAAWSVAGASASVSRPTSSEFPKGTVVYIDHEAMISLGSGLMLRGQFGTARAEHKAESRVYYILPKAAQNR